MSILYLILFVIISILFVKDFKRTLILYAPFKLIFHNSIFLYDASQGITLDLLISFVALIVYISKYGWHIANVSRILRVALVIYTISLIIYGINPKFALFRIVLYEPITAVCYILMLYSVLTNRKDIIMLLKAFCLVACILVIDGMIDIITGVNPIIEIEKSQAGERFIHSPNETMRAGMKRTTSFMPHSISMGVLAALLWGIFAILYLQSKSVQRKKLILFCLITLPLIVIFSNSRTPLITIVCFVPLILSRKVSKWKKFLLLLIAIACLFTFSNYFQWMYDSVFNEEKIDVGGSTTDLRSRQFELALFYFSKEPLLGMGNDFRILKFESVNDAAGMESVWFQLLYLQGIVGTGAYIFLILAGFVRIIKSNKKFTCFVLAWIAAITFSSQVGLSIYMFLIGVLFAEKSYLLFTINKENKSYEL